MKPNFIKPTLGLFAATCMLFACTWGIKYFSDKKEELPFHTQIPSPKEGDEEGEDHEKIRDLWWNAMHLAAPGVNWQKIELANATMLKAQKDILRAQYGENKVTDETFANGKVTGEWSERGSANIAGSIIGADYVPETNNIYTISSGGSLWRGSLAGNNWTILNDDIRFSQSNINAFQKPGGGIRIMLAPQSTSQLTYSDNEGASFTNCGGSLYNPAKYFILNIKRVFVANDAGRTIYAEIACYDYSKSQYSATIFKSADAGKTFEPLDVLQTNYTDRCSAHMAYNSNDVYTVDAASDGVIITTKISGNSINKLVAFVAGSFTTANLKGVNIGGFTTLYLLKDNSSIFRSIDEGQSWTLQGWLPFSSWGRLDVSIKNPDRVFAGAVNAIRSYNAGITWNTVNEWYEYYGNIPGKLHADIMEIKQFKKSDGTPFAIINNHGGVAISYDDLTTTQNISLTGLYSSQYYDVLTNPNKPNEIYSGTQDQGWQLDTAATTPGLQNMVQQISGDYGHLALSENNTHLWTEYPGGWINYYNAPTGYSNNNWTLPGTAKPLYGWILPTATVPGNQNAIYIAGGNITGGDGSYLVKLSALNIPPYTLTPSQFDYDFRKNSKTTVAGISAIEPSVVDASNIYVGAEDGTFFYTNDNGTTWNKSQLAGPGPWYLYGNSIYASTKTSGLVWYAGSGYSNDAVYESTDGGKNFKGIGKGLPPTLVFEICANDDESLLFAGTDAGPYVYIREEGKWYSLTGVNTPLQSYTSVEYVSSQNTVRFGTFGRGIWDFKISSIVLPVSMGSFTAALQKTDALLAWQTVTESNTAYFNIQRSADGINFSNIGKTTAAGSNSNTYHYTDANVTALNRKILYYRLQVVDKNGNSTLSKIVSVNLNQNDQPLFTFYPNPVHTNMRISVNTEGSNALYISITDVSGKKVFSDNVLVNTSVYTGNINVSNLKSGLYFIEVNTSKAGRKSKFIKE